jgi:hypothetical protein
MKIEFHLNAINSWIKEREKILKENEYYELSLLNKK